MDKIMSSLSNGPPLKSMLRELKISPSGYPIQQAREFYAQIASCTEPFTWIWHGRAVIAVPGNGGKMVTTPSIKDELVAQCGESFVSYHFIFRDELSDTSEKILQTLTEEDHKNHIIPQSRIPGQHFAKTTIQETVKHLSMIEQYLKHGFHHMVHFHAITNIKICRGLPMTAELYVTLIKTIYYRIEAAKQQKFVFHGINYYRYLLKFHKKKAPTKMNCDELTVYYEALGDAKEYFIETLERMNLSVDLRTNIYKFHHEKWDFTMKGNRKLRKYPDGNIKEKLRSLKYKSCLYCKHIVCKRKRKGKKQEKNRRCRCKSYYCSKYCQKRAWNYCIDPCKKYYQA